MSGLKRTNKQTNKEIDVSNLLNAIQNATNYTRTENAALTHISTLDGVLDFFYHAPARRGQDNTALFLKAFGEDRLTAIRCLFYIRDIRGGQGERETFRQGLRELYKNFREVFDHILSYVPVYGRWDDIVEYVSNQKVVSVIREQLNLDLGSDEGVSLLAKWMPSINTSSKETVALAHRWVKALGWTPVQYRKNLSALRGKIKLVETLMSQNKWKDISYGQIPSRAGLIYKDAFKRHDGTRYDEFLAAVVRGEEKINSGTLYPYELVAKSLHEKDQTAEAMWKCLPNYADTDDNALVVADVSGSMCGARGPSNIAPITVCISLAIYLAERNKGIFHDKFITFSDTPSVQSLKGDTLYEKVSNLSRATWGMNTNLQSVFNVVLSTAVKAKLPASEMPTKIFIISDMEFDYCVTNNTNLEVIKAKYAVSGYTLPTLIFWNVDSRNDQTPVTMDEKGTYLVSGCSPSIFEKAIKAQATTPMEMMLEVLNGPRYEPITL
jgi:hypothetical protein